MEAVKFFTVKLLLVACFLSLGIFSSSFVEAMVWKKEPTTFHDFTELFHDFTELPLTEDGWTNFRFMIREQNLYQNARVIFVSSSNGNDNIGKDGHYTVNDLSFDEHGMFQPNSAINAYKTIAAGKAQMRNGYPDIMLLNRGEVWEEGYGTWSTSGPSSGARQIMATYGSGDRPKLLRVMPSNGATFTLNGSNIIVSGIWIDTTDWEQAGWPNYTAGFNTGGSSSHHLVEDCKVTHHSQNNLSSAYVAFRRCIFAYGNAHSGFIYTQGEATPRLLEENFFSIPYRASKAETIADGYGRHLYINHGGSAMYEQGLWETAIVRRNIFDAAERGSVDFRTGGVYDNNLGLRGSGIYIAPGGNNENTVQSGRISNSVFHGSSPNKKIISAIGLGSIDGGEAFNNIIIFPEWQGIDGSNTRAIAAQKASLGAPVIKNILIHHNIVYGRAQGRGVQIHVTTDMKNIVVRDNDFQQIHGVVSGLLSGPSGEDFSYLNNRYYTTNPANQWFETHGTFESFATAVGETGEALQVDYTEPSRSPATYNQYLGGTGTVEALLSELMEQSRANWRPEYTACAVNDYIRAGFDKDPVGCTYK